MSRSVKHVPVLKKNDQFFKRLANKRIRKSKDSKPSKHLLNSYDICDYRSRPATPRDSWYDKAKRK